MSITKVYGLIGFPLSHSFSPQYFKQKFKEEQIKDVAYKLFPLEEISAFPQLIKDQTISGLNVTIPYKETVIPFLDELSKAAHEIRAVNCIEFKNGKFIGHNTDVIGFEKSLRPLLQKHHKKALILGTGGAAKAVAYVLSNLGIEFSFVSRSKQKHAISYAQANAQLKECGMLINTTPLGMYPKIDECPDIEFKEISDKHLVYDLVYNPLETRLLQESKKLGATIKNGLEMLEIQAEESWKIWQG